MYVYVCVFVCAAEADLKAKDANISELQDRRAHAHTNSILQPGVAVGVKPLPKVQTYMDKLWERDDNYFIQTYVCPICYSSWAEAIVVCVGRVSFLQERLHSTESR